MPGASTKLTMVVIVPSTETLRILSKPPVAMKILPRVSTVMAAGLTSMADVAGPPSPPVPPPATVVILPCETFLIRAFPLSAIRTFPEPSIAKPLGALKLAEVAGPLSPKPLLPPPAKVVMVPPLTLRTRLFPVSLMYTLPAASPTMPCGLDIDSAALVAGPPSPLKPTEPPPANVRIFP